MEKELDLLRQLALQAASMQSILNQMFKTLRDICDSIEKRTEGDKDEPEINQT